MVRASTNTIPQNNNLEYPLKIIELDDFLLNSDDLLWKSVWKTSASFGKLLKKRTSLDNEQNSYNDEDILTDNIKVPRSLADCSQVTIVFIDSDIYRQHLEKSHLKLVNNMIVLDRQISFNGLEDVRKFFNLVINSKRWLLQGTVKDLTHSENGCSKDLKRKALSSKFKQKNESIIDVLLILNTSENCVREELVNGFKKLINCFSDQSKAIFEINFEDALRIYFKRKLEKSSKKNIHFDILKSNILFTALGGTSSTQSKLINLANNRFDLIFNRLRSALSQKVQRSLHNNNNSSPLLYSKYSLDSLPYLLCFLDDTKSSMTYTSYNDKNFLNIIKNTDTPESSNNTESDSRNEYFSNYKNTRSESEWSSSVNSSFTTYSNSKSFDCLNENSKYVSNYEISDIEMDTSVTCPEKVKYSNRSLNDVTNEYTTKMSNKNLYIKNVTCLKNKASKILNGDSSISSSLSSLSNYLNKKKKLSASFDALNDSQENNKLLNETMDTTSNEPNSKSPIKFSECDFLRKSQETNKIETNEIRENRDEAINRHPALVRANLRSKSADLINETSTTKKTILKIKSNAYQERVTLDQDLIEQTTKMNTYLNSQIIHPKNGPSHVSRKKTVEEVHSKPKLYQQNNNKYAQGYQSSQNLSPKTLAQKSPSNTLAKCYSRQNPKKPISPPPPVFISPNGLIAPPPTTSRLIPQMSYPSYPRRETNKENQIENKIKFNEIRNKFENNCKPFNIQTTSQRQTTVINYNQFNVNKPNFIKMYNQNFGNFRNNVQSAYGHLNLSFKLNGSS